MTFEDRLRNGSLPNGFDGAILPAKCSVSRWHLENIGLTNSLTYEVRIAKIVSFNPLRVTITSGNITSNVTIGGTNQ